MEKDAEVIIISSTKQKNILIELLCIFAALVAFFPIIYAFFVSFMPAKDIYSKELIFFPHKFVLDNYRTVFRRINMVAYVKNSFIIAFICSMTRTVFGSMASYAVEFFEFKGKVAASLLLLSSAIIPQEAIFVQNYATISRLSLVNTYAGICSVYIVNALCILMLWQSFAAYPKPVRDAARLDGCGHISFFFNILIPTELPSLLSVFFTSFVTLWNVYLWPLVISNAGNMRTVQVAITMIKGRDSPDFAPVMAAATLSLAPAVFLFLIARRIVNNQTYEKNYD